MRVLSVPGGVSLLLTSPACCVCVFQGTAVFWYNLFASGEGDYSTRHAACPVLVGNKWGELDFESNSIECHCQETDVKFKRWSWSFILCLIIFFLPSLVSNKWIHERGQEWRRPCGLNETEWWKKKSPHHLSDPPPSPSPLLCDQRTLLQITDDTCGNMGLSPSIQNTPVIPSCYAPSPQIVWVSVEPLDSVSIAATDMFLRLLAGFEKHTCPFFYSWVLSLHSVWTLALWWGGVCQVQPLPHHF